MSFEEKAPETFREENEESLMKITDEINFLYNQTQNKEIKSSHKEVLKKSLILLIYAYYEGFVNKLLLSYINIINFKHLKRKEVKKELVASSMENIFKDYDNISKKNGYFKKDFPDETYLHRYYRRVNLVEEFNNFLDEELKIPDEVINTESNLSVKVLEKNFYKIGIFKLLNEEQESLITKLIKIRNDLAHTGQSSQLPKDFKMIRNLKDEMLKLMSDMIELLFNLLLKESYKK